MKKVKGYCPHCLAWRAFELEGLQQDINQIFSINHPPTFVGGLIHHFGTCSKGHYGPFTVWEPLKVRKYKREPDLQEYEGDRGPLERMIYIAHLNTFRRPLLEWHFTTGHECGLGCPEYREPFDSFVGETWW